MDGYDKIMLGGLGLLVVILFLSIGELVFTKTARHDATVILTQYVPASSSTGVGNSVNGDVVITYSSEEPKYIALVTYQNEDLEVTLTPQKFEELKKGDNLVFFIETGRVFGSRIAAYSNRGK